MRRALLAIASVALVLGLSSAPADAAPATTSTAVSLAPPSVAMKPKPGEVWCYVYSTALGLYWAPLGVASGALCLFAPASRNYALYKCYKKKPVNLGYGLVAAYGAKWHYGKGKCHKYEWGHNMPKKRWVRFMR